MVGESLLIKGEFINTTTNKNKWSVNKSELNSIAGDLAGKPIVADHGKSVWDIVGGFTKGIHDIKTDKVLFEGEIDNPDMMRLILKGRVNFISPGAQADAYCSVCGKSTRPIKLCKCEGSHEIIRNVKVKEGSIVRDPAYQTTTFEPVSFVASVNEVLSSFNKVDKSSIDDAQVQSPVKANEDLGSSGENKKEECIKMPKEKEKEKKETKTEKTEEVEATELKKVGPDALVVIAEKLEQFVTKQEEILKKVDSIVTDLGAVKVPDPKSFERGPPVKGEKKPPEEEEKKEEPLKAEDVKKMFQEAIGELMKKQKTPPEEKEREKEKKETEEEEKEKEKKTEVKGAKIDTSEDIEASSEVTAEGQLDWWKEIVAKARECDII